MRRRPVVVLAPDAVPVRVAYRIAADAPTFGGRVLDSESKAPLGCLRVALEDSAGAAVAEDVPVESEGVAVLHLDEALHVVRELAHRSDPHQVRHERIGVVVRIAAVVVVGEIVVVVEVLPARPNLACELELRLVRVVTFVVRPCHAGAEAGGEGDDAPQRNLLHPNPPERHALDRR